MAVHRAFGAGHKAGAHLNRFSAQGKGGRHAAPIHNAASRNQGQIGFLADGLQQHQGADLFRVLESPAFGAFHHQTIDPSLSAFEGGFQRGHGVVDRDARRFQGRHEFGWAARRGGDKPDARVADVAQHGIVFQKTDGQIHTKRQARRQHGGDFALAVRGFTG